MEPFLGEIRQFSFGFAPKGWLVCHGQLLSIQQFQALFSILGTSFGGDGIRTFALPNLQGRMAYGVGNTVALGGVAGEAFHTLTTAEIPTHTHTAMASGAATPNAGQPTNNYWVAQSANVYAAALPGPGAPTMSAAAISATTATKDSVSIPP